MSWFQLCVLCINQFDYIEKSFYCSVEYGSPLDFIDYPKMKPELGKCYFSLLYSYLSPSPFTLFVVVVVFAVVLLWFYSVLKVVHFRVLKQFFNTYQSFSFYIIWFLCSLPQETILKFKPGYLFLHSDHLFLKKYCLDLCHNMHTFSPLSGLVIGYKHDFQFLFFLFSTWRWKT